MLPLLGHGLLIGLLLLSTLLDFPGLLFGLLLTLLGGQPFLNALLHGGIFFCGLLATGFLRLRGDSLLLEHGVEGVIAKVRI